MTPFFVESFLAGANNDLKASRAAMCEASKRQYGQHSIDTEELRVTPVLLIHTPPCSPKPVISGLCTRSRCAGLNQPR